MNTKEDKKIGIMVYNKIGKKERKKIDTQERYKDNFYMQCFF